MRALDLPGHGARSRAAAGTLDDLVGEIEREAPPTFDLVGYSMGGRLALHFAHRHPDRVRRLVLESASPGLADPTERAARREADEALADRIVRDGIGAFVEHWESLPLFASQERLAEGVRKAQRERRLANRPEGLAYSLRALGTGALPSLWDHLERMAIPTLLIVGELDAKFVGIAEAMAGALPHAEIEVVEDTGHTVHLERPNEWLRRVSQFLG